MSLPVLLQKVAPDDLFCDLFSYPFMWSASHFSCFKPKELQFLGSFHYASATGSNREQVLVNLKQPMVFSLDEQHSYPAYLALGDRQADFNLLVLVIFLSSISFRFLYTFRK